MNEMQSGEASVWKQGPALCYEYDGNTKDIIVKVRSYCNRIEPCVLYYRCVQNYTLQVNFIWDYVLQCTGCKTKIG